jgi:hypothetical protein
MVTRVWKRLEQLKLAHLEQLVALQAEHIEQLQAALERAERDAWNADIVGEMWRAAAEETHAQPGITRDGQIGVVRQ